MTTKIKMLLMFLITAVAGIFAQSGLPTTTIAWEILGITLTGTMFTYIAKNLISPSTSVPGTLNIADIVSGIILAVGTALSDFAASAITSTAIVWTEVAKMVGVVVVGYFAKTLFSAQPK